VWGQDQHHISDHELHATSVDGISGDKLDNGNKTMSSKWDVVAIG